MGENIVPGDNYHFLRLDSVEMTASVWPLLR